MRLKQERIQERNPKTNNSMPTDIEALGVSIQKLHGCKSTWVKSEPVKEAFKGQTVWEGIVEIFDLEGHPEATRCYAWSHGLDDSDKRKFFAVLHKGLVDSPQAAVRAAIVAEYKKNTQG
jgi:hypothetical protein